jgi:hypothetical protein
VGLWVSALNPANPQEFVWSFADGQRATLGEVVIHNYGQGTVGRYSRQFEIWLSEDDVNYTRTMTGTLTAQVGAQIFDLGGVQARYVKLSIIGGYIASYWELGEVEIYGNIPWPHVWTSGSFSGEFAAGNLVDGTTNTSWVANAGANQWSIVADFGEEITFQDLQLMCPGDAWTNMSVVVSSDGDTWSAPSSLPATWRYMIIEMWADASREDLPAISEILWREEE